jgi:hypothetical protein
MIPQLLFLYHQLFLQVRCGNQVISPDWYTLKFAQTPEVPGGSKLEFQIQVQGLRWVWGLPVWTDAAEFGFAFFLNGAPW